ncbi:MAG: hypothetical protein M1833_007164 [Piccolia ochrophora]|nr:MAG: hypothetical protein M1833_007164 [Piccolia ochrophora]
MTVIVLWILLNGISRMNLPSSETLEEESSTSNGEDLHHRRLISSNDRGELFSAGGLTGPATHESVGPNIVYTPVEPRSQEASTPSPLHDFTSSFQECSESRRSEEHLDKARQCETTSKDFLKWADNVQSQQLLQEYVKRESSLHDIANVPEAFLSVGAHKLRERLAVLSHSSDLQGFQSGIHPQTKTFLAFLFDYFSVCDPTKDTFTLCIASKVLKPVHQPDRSTPDSSTSNLSFFRRSAHGTLPKLGKVLSSKLLPRRVKRSFTDCLSDEQGSRHNISYTELSHIENHCEDITLRENTAIIALATLFMLSAITSFICCIRHDHAHREEDEDEDSLVQAAIHRRGNRTSLQSPNFNTFPDHTIPEGDLERGVLAHSDSGSRSDSAHRPSWYQRLFTRSHSPRVDSPVPQGGPANAGTKSAKNKKKKPSKVPRGGENAPITPPPANRTLSGRTTWNSRKALGPLPGNELGDAERGTMRSVSTGNAYEMGDLGNARRTAALSKVVERTDEEH